MRYICTSIVATLVLVSTSTADNYTIATNGMTFAPATLDVQPGDIITFEVGPYHTATSGSSCSSDGLFDYGSGTNTWTVPDSVAGTTVDYFCIPHCSMGMTGAINVADIINVPADHATIQGAIDASSDGDVIAIAAGTYNEHSLNTDGKAITIGSASGNLDVTIDAQQGGSVFTIESGEGDGTVIKDLVITGGLASGSWPSGHGGGIHCAYSSPTISGCTITGNTANTGGGGIHCNNNSNPTISSCTIEGNTASYGGGGIFCWNTSEPTITDCTISGNAAVYSDGGGVWCGSEPTITDCTISGNAAVYGGGVYCGLDGNPTISDCTIEGNTANTGGGGIHCQGFGATISDCTIADNAAGSWAGGIFCGGFTTAITDCTIADNMAGGNGGGIYCEDNSTHIINGCTISGNTANYYGGGIYSFNASNTTISNCTISGNGANYNGGGICSLYGSPTISDSEICGNAPDQIYGGYEDNGGNTVADECPEEDCVADLNNSGVVDIEDLLLLIGGWGTSDGDCDADGDTDIEDLLVLIGGWGACP